MQHSTKRPMSIIAAAIFIATLNGDSVALAQIQNPIQVFKDSLKQSKQTSRQAQPQKPAQPAAGPQSATQQAAPAAPGAANASAPQAADIGTFAETARLAAAAGFVDVAGIKLGMNSDQVIEALRADNPRLKVNLGHMFRAADDLAERSKGRPGGTTGPIIGIDATFADAKSIEHVLVDFTSPPNATAATAVTRELAFLAGNEPTVGNVLAGLRKKYGPETFGPQNDPVGSANNLSWMFDANGLLLKNDPAGHYERCTPRASRSGISQEFESNLQTALTTIYAPAVNCPTMTVVQALVQKTQQDAKLATSVTVGMENYPLELSDRLAVKAYATQLAQQARDKADKDAAQKGTPKF